MRAELWREQAVKASTATCLSRRHCSKTCHDGCLGQCPCYISCHAAIARPCPYRQDIRQRSRHQTECGRRHSASSRALLAQARFVSYSPVDASRVVWFMGSMGASYGA